MSPRLAVATALLLTALASCGDAPDVAAEPLTERATPGGLAAATLAHLDAHETGDLRGGVTDMEDQRHVAVSLVLDGGDNTLEVRASDPAYLPGDRGPDECGPDDRRRRPGVTHECRVLDDGTVVDAYLVTARKATGGRSIALAYAEGPDRSVQVQLDSGSEVPELTLDELLAVAEDPLVAWTTSPALNDAGESLDIAVEDRVAR